MANMDLTDLRKVLGHQYNFPTMPAVVVQIMQVLNSYDSSVSEVANVIKKDQTTATKILRLINSAAYSISRRVTTIDEAVSMLGFNTVMNLTMGTAILDSFKIINFNLVEFWTHTIAVSMASRFFAERVKGSNSADTAATIGLIHDIGKLAFIMSVPDKYKLVIQQTKLKQDVSIYIEQEVLGFDHTEVGLLLARRWGWPDIFQEAISCHHNPKQATLDPLMTYCIYLANLAAHVLLDKEYQEVSFATITDIRRIPLELRNSVSLQDWKSCLAHIMKGKAEIESFLKVMR